LEPDLNKAISELGWQDPHYRSRFDGPIDDVELAHEMALAMDPDMEQVIWAKDLHAELLDAPDETYRRAGQKAEVFNDLVEAQKAADDQRTGDEQSRGYYIKDKNAAYVRRLTGDRSAKPTRITNGFVAEFLEPAAERSQRAADKAGELVFYKQRTRENIAVYEQNLTKREQTVFARLQPREEDMDVSWAGGDEEALNLSKRSNELWDIYRKKLAVEAVARTFGRTTTRGFSREDMETLAEVVAKDYMITA
jgi:hypothetical protein